MSSDKLSIHEIYDLIGGASTVQRLVDEFYARVEADEELRSIFPDDLEPGKRYQFLFLSQFFGGPTNYSDERGHPRLRMRHMPYPINKTARDKWLQYMLEAIDVVGIPEPARSLMHEYFERGSTFMVNIFEETRDD